jgi:hypothetical protein
MCEQTEHVRQPNNPAFLCLQGYLGPANIFLLFAAISVLALVFVILIVPETKGLSLEDIESKILK